MRAVAVLRALGPIDAANLRRDPLLRWMIALTPAIGLLYRFLVPVVGDWMGGRFGIDIVPYHPLIASTLVLMTPMLFGTVIGFLLLDQRDDRTLTALRVTPLTATGYLAYRISIPVLLSILTTPVALELSGLAGIGLGKQLLAAVAAAPFAPAFALFIAAFARNKVQGFALMKAAGVINWPPVIAWFVASKWQLLFGLAPTYWPAKVYWELEAGGPAAGLYAAVSVLYLGLLIVPLGRRFERETSG